MNRSNTKPARSKSKSRAARRLRIFLLGNGRRPRVITEAENIRQLIAGRAEIVATDLRFEQDLSQLEADLAVVLGGDGAILRAARQMAYRQVPVLGVNLGRLAFLAEVAPEEFAGSFEHLVSGRYQVVEHIMLECTVASGRQAAKSLLGLNEILVHTAPPYHMLDIELVVDEEHVTTYSADGLIVATPIGSTAHSLAAGGPIVRQDMAAFVITPVCPHTLTNRPLVDSADKTYQLMVRQGGTLIVDGQVQVPLAGGECVTVRRAPVTFRLVKIPGHSYYRRLREKLSWGGQTVAKKSD